MRPLSKAQRLPRWRRQLWLARQQHHPKPCEYGHVDCSASEAGACSDELLHLIEAEEPDVLPAPWARRLTRRCPLCGRTRRTVARAWCKHGHAHAEMQPVAPKGDQ